MKSIMCAFGLHFPAHAYKNVSGWVLELDVSDCIDLMRKVVGFRS